MQGSIGVMLLAVVGALALVIGTSGLPYVAVVCVAACVAVSLDTRRARRAERAAR